MRRGFAIALAVCLGAPAARGEPRGPILFRGSPTGGLDEQRLADAVRIQTRDFGVEWTTDEAAPAALIVWYEARPLPDGKLAVALWAIRPGAPVVTRTLRLQQALDDELYRALALKIRALLTESAPAAPVAARPTAPAPAPLGGALEAGYHLALTDPIGSYRQGVAVAVALRVGRRFEGALGVAVDSRIDHRFAAGSASASVVPVWVAARLVGRRGRVGGGIGARAGLVVIAAEGSTADGTSGSLVRFAALVGLEARLRWQLYDHLALHLEATADLLAPHQLFTLAGASALDVGAFAIGVGAGLTASFP